MKNRLIATLLSVVYISQGFVFADMIDINANPITSTSSVGKDEKIEILNKVTASIDTSTEVDKASTSVGNPNQGTQGTSIGMGYLTPQNQFGFAFLDNYHHCYHSGSCSRAWKGKVTVSHNDLGGTFPYNNVVNKTITARTFYDGARDYFLKDSTFRKSIEDLTVNDLKNVNLQTDDTGRQFVSAAMYVRWMFDVQTGLAGGGEYVASRPILKGTSLKNGPYIAMGDNFSSENFSGKTIEASQKKYVASMPSLLNRSFSSSKYLGKDVRLTSSQEGSLVNTNMALLFKKSEFRRYVSYNGDNLENFEFVYPVEQTTLKTQNQKATSGLTNSISASVKYSDSSNTTIDKYVFTVKTNSLKPSNVYTDPESSYTFNHKNGEIDGSSGKEPNENQADKWNNINAQSLTIRGVSGDVLYSTPIKNNNGKVVIEVSPADVGYKSLSGATAELDTNYDTHLRYMSKKEVVETNYAIGDKNSSDIRSYEEIKSYINDKSNSDSSIIVDTVKLTRYENESNPRTIKVYKTASKTNQSSKVKASIPFTNGGDPVSPTPVVKIDPPNALTKLEGGKFDVNISLDPKGVSIGDNGTDIWISDFKVQPVTVTAQNKEIIYKHDEPITDFSNNNLNFSIRAVTANPSHIGKAIVEAEYSYILNIRQWEEREVEVDGESVMEKVYLGTSQTHHSGKITGDFNIYSLSGVSS